jgi:glycosyltransferase involved in cell wall biosynthesis
MAPRISVIIPFRDARPHLPALVTALRSQTISLDRFEVIWIDDASRDGGGLWLQEQLSPGWQLSTFSEPRGSYAARNKGVQVATSDNLAFTDADCRPHPDWLERGLIALTDGPRAAGRIQTKLSAAPSLAEIVDAGRFFRQRHYVQEGFAAGANLFVRRTVFDAVGGFAEHLKSGGDQEFGWRCSKAGIPIHFAERAVVDHAARASIRELLKKGERVGFGSGQMLRSRGIPARTLAKRARERFRNVRTHQVSDGALPPVGIVRSCSVTAVHLLLVLVNAAGALRGLLSDGGAASRRHDARHSKVSG